MTEKSNTLEVKGIQQGNTCCCCLSVVLVVYIHLILLQAPTTVISIIQFFFNPYFNNVLYVKLVQSQSLLRQELADWSSALMPPVKKGRVFSGEMWKQTPKRDGEVLFREPTNVVVRFRGKCCTNNVLQDRMSQHHPSSHLQPSVLCHSRQDETGTAERGEREKGLENKPWCIWQPGWCSRGRKASELWENTQKQHKLAVS